MKQRIALIVLTALTAGALYILSTRSRDSHVSLRAVEEIAGETLSGVDKLGQRLARISAAEEMRVGDAVAGRIATYEKESSGALRDRYVADVGRGLEPLISQRGLRYRFHVLESPRVNAFAIPGGHVYVTTGMLDFIETEGELASVLAHEMNHIELRHCVERMQYELAARKLGGDVAAAAVALGYGLYSQGYSKQKETEADTGAFYLIVQARYDPRQAERLFSRVADKFEEPRPAKASSPQEEAGELLKTSLTDYFQTHPPLRERIAQNQRLLAREKMTGVFYEGRENYRRLIPRSTYGFSSEWHPLTTP